MTIEFRCDCGELFQVEDELAGRKGRCPTCKRIMVVPEKEAEPLELQDEIQEEQEQEYPDMHSRVDALKPACEPPTGGRVEEEVEVLRGWDGPEPDLERMENSVSRPPAGSWKGIPRPLLLGVPAVLAGALLLFLLVRPSSQRSEHPALERAPSASMSQKLTAPSQPQTEPTPTTSAPPQAAEPPKPEPPPSPSAALPSQPEKSAPAKPSPAPAAKEEEKRQAAAPSSSAPAAPLKTSAPSKEAKPKQTPAQPQAAAATRAPSPSSENYTVNVGAFKSQGMADAYADVLRKRGLDPFVWATELTKGQGKMYRVSIGRFPTKRQADLYAKELKEKHGLNTYVAKKPGS